ncbi:hypothetical protein EZS27_032336 [termite gut metagenome]|uniref:Uncharacterized protein n=1 Tax=termite gut metagenome TaxID=433724 RepID=A0A5J4Q924_9ZZZZ
MRNKIRKSTWLTVVLLVYVSVMAVYMLPRNSEMSHTEKYITLNLSINTISSIRKAPPCTLNPR